MTIPPPTPASGEIDLANDERWALVQRIAAGPHLGKAHQLRDLLLFLAKRAIISPLGDLTEQEIGSRVLGRRPDYNPQEDNIVRVQIRRLRQKLDEYFISDGLEEPIVVSIPKGGHVLRFDVRPKPILEPAAVASPARFGPWLWVGLTIVAIGIGAAAFLAGRYSRGLTDVSARSLPPQRRLQKPAVAETLREG